MTAEPLPPGPPATHVRPVPVGVKALLAGVVAGGVMTGLAGFDFVATSGHPVEQATIVEQRSTSNRTMCGRTLVNNTYEQETTFVVASPAPRLPARFTYLSCPMPETVGDVVPVVRSDAGPGAPVYVYPMTEFGQLLQFGAVSALIATVVTWLWLQATRLMNSVIGRT